MFLFLGDTRFGFELVNQKMFKNENFKNGPSHILCHLPFESNNVSKH